VLDGGVRFDGSNDFLDGSTSNPIKWGLVLHNGGVGQDSKASGRFLGNIGGASVVYGMVTNDYDNETFSVLEPSDNSGGVTGNVIGTNEVLPTTPDYQLNIFSESSIWGFGDDIFNLERREGAPINYVSSFRLGKRIGVNQYFDNSIFAVLCGYNSLTQEMVKTLQGWAAHKFGFTDKLPSDHRYSDSPPTV